MLAQIVGSHVGLMLGAANESDLQSTKHETLGYAMLAVCVKRAACCDWSSCSRCQPIA